MRRRDDRLCQVLAFPIGRRVATVPRSLAELPRVALKVAEIHRLHVGAADALETFVDRILERLREERGGAA